MKKETKEKTENNRKNNHAITSTRKSPPQTPHEKIPWLIMKSILCTACICCTATMYCNSSVNWCICCTCTLSFQILLVKSHSWPETAEQGHEIDKAMAMAGRGHVAEQLLTRIRLDVVRRLRTRFRLLQLSGIHHGLTALPSCLLGLERYRYLFSRCSQLFSHVEGWGGTHFVALRRPQGPPRGGEVFYCWTALRPNGQEQE